MVPEATGRILEAVGDGFPPACQREFIPMLLSFS